MTPLFVACFATLLNVAASIAVGFSRASKVRNAIDYQIAGREVSLTTYATSSVGYALQMASIFLFAYWGFLYGVGALWTVLFWFGGYWLLYALLPRFAPYLESAEPMTLHEYLAKCFRGGRRLQLLAASATIAGLLGTMLAEVDYTLLVYTPIVQRYATAIPAARQNLALEVFFLGIGLSYIIKNGFKADINTIKFRVPTAYVGFIAVLLGALPAVWATSGSVAFFRIAIAFGVVLLLLIFSKINFRASRPWTRHALFPDWQIVIPIAGFLILFVVWWSTVRSGPPGSATDVLSTPIWKQLKAQGWLGIGSLFLANVLWMPVDLSTWQRIESIDRSGDVIKRLREGTWRVVFESPASWCLGVLLGWVINAGGFLRPDQAADTALASFSQRLSDGQVPGASPMQAAIMYFFLVGACVAVMLSTVDSLFAAIAYTVDRDYVGGTLRSLRRARWLSVSILVLGTALYELARHVLRANLSTLLYGAYAAQLALIVVVLLMLYSTRLSGRAAIWSLLFGFLGTAAATYLAIRSEKPEFAVLPPLCAILGAMAGYIMFYRFEPPTVIPSSASSGR